MIYPGPNAMHVKYGVQAGEDVSTSFNNSLSIYILIEDWRRNSLNQVEHQTILM